MKPIVKFDRRKETTCSGEYQVNNNQGIIIVYARRCKSRNVDMRWVIFHEYCHHLINSINLLSILFNHVNSYTINKYNKQKKPVSFIYQHLPEERMCNAFADVMMFFNK